MSRYQHTRDEARIRAAISSMPYGGLERIRAAASKVGGDAHRPEPITLERVADYLEALRDTLAEIVQEQRLRDSELHQLKSDVAAVRRLLGIGGGP